MILEIGGAVFWCLLGFIITEVVSWGIHKYVMHGILWKIHKSHHQHTGGFFEWNDVFTLFFGGVALLMLFLGIDTLDYRFWIGCGMSGYGLTYFILHDVMIHRRLKGPDRPKSLFLQAIVKAHRDHHKTKTCRGAVSFGLLIVPRKYYKKKIK